MRNTFSKRERLKVGKEGEGERESWGRGIHADVERKIKRKKYTHRIETYRSEKNLMKGAIMFLIHVYHPNCNTCMCKDEKDVEKRDMYMYNSKAIKKE